MGRKTTIALLASIALAAVTADFGLANTPPPLPPMPNPPPLPSQMPPALPPQAQAQTGGGPATLGALASIVAIGVSDKWIGQADATTYTLSNTTDANTVRYYYAPGPTTGKVKVTALVTIAPQPGDTAGAGVLYSYNPQTSSYMAVALQANNTVAVYARDQSGFNQVMSSSSDGLLKPGVNEVTIIGEGNSAQIFVNGQSMGSISNDMISTQYPAGILVLGRGSFTFSGYSHEMTQ